MYASSHKRTTKNTRWCALACPTSKVMSNSMNNGTWSRGRVATRRWSVYLCIGSVRLCLCLSLSEARKPIRFTATRNTKICRNVKGVAPPPSRFPFLPPLGTCLRATGDLDHRRPGDPSSWWRPRHSRDRLRPRLQPRCPGGGLAGGLGPRLARRSRSSSERGSRRSGTVEGYPTASR